MKVLSVTVLDNRGDKPPFLEGEVAYGFVEFNDGRRIGFTSTAGLDDEVTGGWGPVDERHVKLAEETLREAGILPKKCQSGNGMTFDGEGLCTRDATSKVEVSISRQGTVRSEVFDMCRSCAGSWSVKHPTTVKML